MSFVSKDNTAVEPRFGSSLRAQPDIVTTFGSGMLVTGNVVATGAVQIFGRVIGDVRAEHLIIGPGAYVEGTVTARDAVVQGTFKGTLYANAVKLQGEALVQGEVYNKSLSIEPNVVFEGSSRRLERAVDAPSVNEAKVQTQAQPAAALPKVEEPLELVPQQFADLPSEVDNDVLA